MNWLQRGLRCADRQENLEVKEKAQDTWELHGFLSVRSPLYKARSARDLEKNGGSLLSKAGMGSKIRSWLRLLQPGKFGSLRSHACSVPENPAVLHLKWPENQDSASCTPEIPADYAPEVTRKRKDVAVVT